MNDDIITTELMAFPIFQIVGKNVFKTPADPKSDFSELFPMFSIGPQKEPTYSRQLGRQLLAQCPFPSRLLAGSFGHSAAPRPGADI